MAFHRFQIKSCYALERTKIPVQECSKKYIIFIDHEHLLFSAIITLIAAVPAQTTTIVVRDVK